MGSSAHGLTLTRLAEGRIEAIVLGFVHDSIHNAAHCLADLAYHRIHLALIRKERRQGLAQHVEPGIDSRCEALVTGEGQVHLQRRLVHEPVDAPVEIDKRAGGFQALEAPSQLSHTPFSCCVSTLLHSGPEAHGLTGLPRFLQ
jgi:hypothetical protein